MYIRFITQFINEDNERETDIFKALRHVAKHPLTQDEDANTLKAINRWFNVNLEKPAKFSNASNPNAEAIALSWFKDSAKAHILLIYDIIEVLDKYNLVVEQIKSKNPGYIVYEDEFQVAAIPFRTHRKKVI